MHIGRLKFDLRRAYNFPQFGNVDQRFPDLIQVSGGGIVILFVKTVWVGKMRVFTAKLSRFLVHQLRKRFVGTGYIFGQGVGGVVSRANE